MTEQIMPLIVRINFIEQQIRHLNHEKQALEKELNQFAVGDDGVSPSGK
jgi:hypothetical protein